MSTTCPKARSAVQSWATTALLMLRMNEHLSAEDDGLPLAEHLSETYSPWYTIKLNYIAPDDLYRARRPNAGPDPRRGHP